MILTDDCRTTAERMPLYLEASLPLEEMKAVDAHLVHCEGCRQSLERLKFMQGLGQSLIRPEELRDDFRETTGKRLMAIPAAEEALEEEEAPFYERPPKTLLDILQERLGAAPWWIVSGAFHTLLILLVTLIGMAILRSESNDPVIVTDLQKQREPEEIKEKVKRDIFTKPTPIENVEVVSDLPPVVTHEEVEVAEVLETENDSDAQDAHGEDGISDVFLGGSGNVAAIGLGGGGGGAFGRPTGQGGRLRRARANGGGKETESAVDKALAWLARNQEAEGHWDCTKHGGGKSDTAMTGFALLAFLGAGHTEKIGKYRENVRKAIDWLGKHQDEKGLVFNKDKGGRGYNHSIASIALAEAAAMARVTKTKEIAQKAVDYSVNIHQCGEGSEKRGWRYSPKQAGDLSNTGWFIMQLKSAKVAGLNVPHGGFEGAKWFLDHVEMKDFLQKYPNLKSGDYDNGRHRYGYTKPGGTKRLTAVGCLCRQFMGVPAEELRGGVEYFVNRQIPSKEKVDLYYWYYGTLCTFQQGGDVWKKWNDALKGSLLPTQRVGGAEDGSWDPTGSYSQAWGRVGQTALSCLCLEVYYRYLPMYRE